MAKVSTLGDPQLLTRAAELLGFAAPAENAKNHLREDLAFRVRHKDAGMQVSEAQCWFVLILINHTRLGGRSDIYVFVTSSDTIGKKGKFVGIGLLVMSPSSTKMLNEFK